MAKLDKIVEVLENWQKGYNKANKGDKQLGDIRSTLNGGRSLSPSPSLQELSTREIEELRRAWNGKGAMGYEPDFAGYNDVGPQKYQGIPIKDRDLAILKGEVDPYQFVEQPNYGRDLRKPNTNVRIGDDRNLRKPSILSDRDLINPKDLKPPLSPADKKSFYETIDRGSRGWQDIEKTSAQRGYDYENMLEFLNKNTDTNF